MSRITRVCIDVALATIGIAVLIWFLALFVLLALASAHEAPSGWMYPVECCSHSDCDVVIKHGEYDGLATMTTAKHGEIAVPVQKLTNGTRPSQDQDWHICAWPVKKLDASAKRTIFCIFAPGGS